MTLINSIRGSVTRSEDGKITTFSLSGRNRDGFGAGVRCDVQTSRLQADPGLFKRTLDRLARDLPRYDLV